jgi:hypothetical protein
MAAVTVSLISLARDTFGDVQARARDTFGDAQARYSQTNSNITYSAFYVALILSLSAAATSFMDALRIMDRINEGDFKSGHYVGVNLLFRLNYILLVASQVALLLGLSYFISGTQTLVVGSVYSATCVVVAILGSLQYLFRSKVVRRRGRAFLEFLGLS